MRIVRMTLVALAIAAASAVTARAAGDPGRIYGKITTVDGDVFEGMIRWDRNEGVWADYLNGNKELRDDRKSRRRRYGDRRRKITIFGIPIGYSTTYDYSSGSAQCGVRMGHIRMLEFIDDDAVLVYLKSGQEMELQAGSSDIGRGIRDLVIEDRDEGEIGFEWDDVETVEFMQDRSPEPSNFGKRLYGTVSTRYGDEFTGWICWDVDEAFTVDVLDGKEKNRDRKIEFGDIRRIERRNSSSARIYLKNGREIVLRGTNDVDDSNRGIIVTDLDIGEIGIEWDEFESLELKDAPPGLTYDTFGGGGYIEGTVYTGDGHDYTGRIRWDDDEEYTWELLDGDYRDIEFDIEFSRIAEIRKRGSRSAIVILRDGREFRLRGSNDVDSDNKGIFIETSSGDEEEIDWDDFEKAVFR